MKTYKNIKSVKALLFDFDGTLAKTMEDNYRGWFEVFKEYGIFLQRDDFFPLEGMKVQEIVVQIAQKYNLKDIDVDKAVKKKEEIFKRIHSFSLYHGVIEFLHSLKSDVLVAIVTAARRERIFSTTPKDFLDRFDVIISSDDLKRFKPYPDPYIEAMKMLDVSADECIVIENAPLGIQSAKSAGIVCIAIASTMDTKYLQEADKIIEKFSDLSSVEIIKEMVIEKGKYSQ